MKDRALPAELAARFTVEGLLGSGAMGAVFKARERATGDPVAIKLLIREGQPVMVARMEREAAAMLRLSHPNLPRFHEAGRSETGPWLVMEWIAGASLQDRPPPPDRALPVMLEVGAGLQAIHDAGLLHRDVKPANVMLEEGGRAVLMDLGLALDPERTRLTHSGAVGTPLYMPPEVVGGDPGQAPTFDWYGWGATLYWLLEGRPPIEVGDLVARLGPKRSTPWPEPVFSRVPPDSDAARVARACMAPRPEDRPDSLAAVRALLAPPPGRGRSPERTPSGRDAPRQPSPAVSPSSVDRSGSHDPLVSSRSSGPVPAPGRGTGWVLPWLLGAAGILAGVFLRPGSGTTAPPGTVEATPGEPQVEDGPGQAAVPALLPPDLPQAVRDDLARARDLWVGPEGRLIQARNRSDVDRPLLTRDPALFAESVGHLSSISRFLAWARAGGTPDQLAPATREALVGLDPELEAWLGERIFEPYLSLPEGGPPVSLTGRVPTVPVPQGEGDFTGPAADAFRVLLRAIAARVEVQAAADRNAGALKSEAGLISLVRTAGVSNLDRFMGGLVPIRSSRLEVRRWLADVPFLIHRSMVQVRRALVLQPDPGEAARLAWWAGRLVSLVDYGLYAGFATLDPDTLFGGPGPGATGAFLKGEFLRKSTWRVESMGQALEPRLEALEQSLKEAATIDTGTRWGRLCRVKAVADLVETYSRIADQDGLNRTAGTHLPLLRESADDFPLETFTSLLGAAYPESGPATLPSGPAREILAIAEARLGRLPDQGGNALIERFRSLMTGYRERAGSPRDGSSR